MVKVMDYRIVASELKLQFCYDIHFQTNTFGKPNQVGWHCGVIVKVLDCGIIVSEFNLHLFYYIHFWTDTLGKGITPLILSAMG